MSAKLLVIGIIIAVVAIVFYFRTKKTRGLKSDLQKHTDRPDTTEL